jgi:hypothetical protein
MGSWHRAAGGGGAGRICGDESAMGGAASMDSSTAASSVWRAVRCGTPFQTYGGIVVPTRVEPCLLSDCALLSAMTQHAASSGI